MIGLSHGPARDPLPPGCEPVRLPEIEFPDESLEAVWAATVDRLEPLPDRSGPPGRRWASLGLAAAAMVALSATAALVWISGPLAPNEEPDEPGELSEAELDRLDQDVREVLMLVSTALRRTETAALDEVIRGRTAPAVEVFSRSE